MTAVLVPLDEFKAHLLVPQVTNQDTLLQSILDGTEVLLVSQCTRSHAPFQDAQTGRVEVHDGQGCGILFVDYPIAVLTSLKIGRDPANPRESPNPADINQLVWGQGDRRIQRVGDERFYPGLGWLSARFGELGERRVVFVTYDTLADLPEICKLAIKKVGAQIYRQLGSEDASQETLGSYSHQLVKIAEGEPIWEQAVKEHSRLTLL